MKVRFLLLFLGLSASTASALAADGKTIATSGNGNGAHACSSCHGNLGEGRPLSGYPRLAGLPADYIVRQLANFENGDRSNGLMHEIAKALDENERKAVADYYSHMKAPRVETYTGTSAQQIAQGRGLAKQGDWNQGVPPCSQCHGLEGEGVGGTFPRLAAQSAGYLEKQLLDWKKGDRTGDPLNLMTGVASKLDDTEIAAVAAYYASLSGDKPPVEATP